MDTSSGSDYIPERTEGGGSGSGSESLETECEYSSEAVGSDSREVIYTGRGKQRAVLCDVEAVWRSFEEDGLMDSSGSDFEVGVDSGGESSPDVSLVEESGGGDEGEGSEEEEGSRHRSTHSTRKKVVPGQERRLSRKAKGNGVVDAGERVIGEKGGGVIIRGRCTLERVVSLNKRMTEYQREAMMGTVFTPILKHCAFEMERNLSTCPCQGMGTT